MKKYNKLIRRCRKIIKCDTARISDPCGKLYLVIGFNRNTKDDDGQWMKNGEPHDFNYVSEQTIASGDTEEELIESLKEYIRLTDITTEDYLKELIEAK